MFIVIKTYEFNNTTIYFQLYNIIKFVSIIFILNNNFHITYILKSIYFYFGIKKYFININLIFDK